MKNLKDIILEKLKVRKSSSVRSDLFIDDIETVVDCLYSDDISKRQEAIDCIREEILDTNCKQLTSTRTVKSSDLNYIELSRIKLNDDVPNCITVCKRYNANYVVIVIMADDTTYNNRPRRYIEGWGTTQPNLAPKTQELYEIPENSILNKICDLIREKYRR